jgi:hypothetical protein
MEASEQAAFEAALAADASLQQELDLYREVHAGLQQHFQPNQPLQQTLQGLRGEFFTTGAKVVPFKRYMRSAVAVAAILIAVVFIWQPWKPNLYNEFAATAMIAPVERSGEQDALQDAVTAFNKKDFATAASLLEQTHDTTNSFVNFYYAVALLQTDRTNQARPVFNQLYAGESAFKYEAAFYLGLSYLKEKDKATCINWLQKIPADAPNYSKAQELLKKL